MTHVIQAGHCLESRVERARQLEESWRRLFFLCHSYVVLQWTKWTWGTDFSIFSSPVGWSHENQWRFQIQTPVEALPATWLVLVRQLWPLNMFNACLKPNHVCDTVQTHSSSAKLTRPVLENGHGMVKVCQGIIVGNYQSKRMCMLIARWRRLLLD